MIINELILESAGAAIVHYHAGETIFTEDDFPKNYYQISQGRVKLNNYNDEGKEVLQTILETGQSVGESLLFVDEVTYPVNAIAISACTLFKLGKDSFFDLLLEKPDISLMMNRHLSQILYFRQVMGPILGTNSSIYKIKTLFDYLKGKQDKKGVFSFEIPFTRQEIANLTGLRVETAIRTIKAMEKDNTVQIRNRKILY